MSANSVLILESLVPNSSASLLNFSTWCFKSIISDSFSFACFSISNSFSDWDWPSVFWLLIISSLMIFSFSSSFSDSWNFFCINTNSSFFSINCSSISKYLLASASKFSHLFCSCANSLLRMDILSWRSRFSFKTSCMLADCFSIFSSFFSSSSFSQVTDKLFSSKLIILALRFFMSSSTSALPLSPSELSISNSSSLNCRSSFFFLSSSNSSFTFEDSPPCCCLNASNSCFNCTNLASASSVWLAALATSALSRSLSFRSCSMCCSFSFSWSFRADVLDRTVAGVTRPPANQKHLNQQL